MWVESKGGLVDKPKYTIMLCAGSVVLC